jgi:DNA-binding transcriptional LysR family regulator
MSEKTVPACSPDFRDRYGISQPSDLVDVPLLHLTTRPDAWEQWFADNEVPPQTVHGMLFDQFATAAQAAIAGLGVALLPTFLIQDELKRGDLVASVNREMESKERYYLAFPAERADYAPLSAFRDWIVREAAA